MNLLYIAFGNGIDTHKQIAFSIYTFLAQKQVICSINIITDNAEFFKHLLPYVKVISITEDELKEWRGKHKYMWRIKIKAIEKICHLYNGQQVLYLDADTFLYGDILTIKNSLDKGVAVMHENEGLLSRKKSKTQKKMWRQVYNKTFSNVIMQQTDSMWNAGVIATPNTQNGDDIKLALSICDEMSNAGVAAYFIEQYSFSLALQKSYGLEEAKTAIAHYWATRHLWNNKINIFFLEVYFKQLNTESIIEKIKALDKSGVPVFAKIRNTGIRLKLMVDKMFPNKNVQYISKNLNAFYKPKM